MSEQGVLITVQSRFEFLAAFGVLAIMVLTGIVIALLYAGEYLYALILVGVIFALVVGIRVALRTAKNIEHARERAATRTDRFDLSYRCQVNCEFIYPVNSYQ